MSWWWPFDRLTSFFFRQETEPETVPASVTPHPLAKRRRVHLGIDYGTSASKLVLRDYGAPGGEQAFVLSRHGTFRFSSSVAVCDQTLYFGWTPDDESGPGERATWYESIKMRVAAEVKGNAERYCYGPLPELPPHCTAQDLAALTLWWLISEGNRAASILLPSADIMLGMTVGIPMSFFTDQTLQKTFLAITKTAWSLYRRAGVLPEPMLALSNAESLLQRAYTAAAGLQIADKSIRNWVRSEAEAAMWWAFQSPEVPAGTFAKVDIGAGTTNASVFRITETTENDRRVKSHLIFYGAGSSPVGMDALDEALSRWNASDPKQCLQYRGRENALLSTELMGDWCEEVLRAIVLASRRPWKQLLDKLGGYVGRDPSWRQCRMFLIGGGSLVHALQRRLPVYPFDPTIRFRIQNLEVPPDLRTMDHHPIARDRLPFVLVAYGLSQLELAIPEVNTPDEVETLPPISVRHLPDHEELYPP